MVCIPNRQFHSFFVSMKHLGPYKKYIVAAAVIQSIVVIIGGFILFKYSAEKDSAIDETQDTPRVEQPQRDSN